MKAPSADNVSPSVKRLNPSIYGGTNVYPTVRGPAPVSHATHQPALAINHQARQCTDEAKLNKTERAYLAYLRMLKVPLLRIQQITLKLADDTRFTPDFSHLDENGRMVFVDVKGGFTREDSFIKIKVAARLFCEYRFVIAKRCKASEPWEHIEIKP